MAKGNMLQGMARGSVGDIVFSRTKGQQVARVRNRRPTNPQTNMQMRQRSAFLCPLLFYKRGRQAQFRFAFENKSAQESDFNAFMRYNALAGIPVTPDERNLEQFPMLGKYAMSRGSLTPLRFSCVEKDVDNVQLKVLFDFGTQPKTIGEFSQKLVKSGDYMNGDIVTCFIIAGGLIDGNTISEYDRIWRIQQFTLDVNSTAALSTIQVVATTDGFTVDGLHAYNQSCVGVGAIVSRNTASGLKVSNCDLLLSSNSDLIYRYMRSDNYRDMVAAAWGAQGKAVLQGSLSANQGSTAAPSVPGVAVNVSSVTVDGVSLPKGNDKTLGSGVSSAAIVINGKNLADVSVTTTAGANIAITSQTATKIEATISNVQANTTHDILINSEKWGSVSGATSLNGDYS